MNTTDAELLLTAETALARRAAVLAALPDPGYEPRPAVRAMIEERAFRIRGGEGPLGLADSVNRFRTIAGDIAAAAAMLTRWDRVVLAVRAAVREYQTAYTAATNANDRTRAERGLQQATADVTLLESTGGWPRMLQTSLALSDATGAEFGQRDVAELKHPSSHARRIDELEEKAVEVRNRIAAHTASLNTLLDDLDANPLPVTAAA